MFVAIRKYINCNDVKATKRFAEAKLLPELRQLSGFISYAVIYTDNHSIFSITVFKERKGAERAAELARSHICIYCQALLPNSPTCTITEVPD